MLCEYYKAMQNSQTFQAGSSSVLIKESFDLPVCVFLCVWRWLAKSTAYTKLKFVTLAQRVA